MFIVVVKKHAPLNSHRIKRKYQPAWLTPQTLDCIKECNKCEVNGKMDAYRILRNKVSKMIDSANIETYQTKIEGGKNDLRLVLKLFQQFGTSKMGNSKDNSFEIKINDNIISNDQDIANVFNDYFVNIPYNLKEPIKPFEFESYFKIL